VHWAGWVRVGILAASDAHRLGHLGRSVPLLAANHWAHNSPSSIADERRRYKSIGIAIEATVRPDRTLLLGILWCSCSVVLRNHPHALYLYRAVQHHRSGSSHGQVWDSELFLRYIRGASSSADFDLRRNSDPIHQGETKEPLCSFPQIYHDTWHNSLLSTRSSSCSSPQISSNVPTYLALCRARLSLFFATCGS
jgi:hypothetical protein